MYRNRSIDRVVAGSRRRFIARTALALLGAIGWRIPSAASDSEEIVQNKGLGGASSNFDAAVERVQSLAVRHLKEHGLAQIPAAPVLTGHAYNGGLRYDESGVLDRAGAGALIVQDCARVEDIQDRARHGVLPYFHILSCNTGGVKDVPAVIDLCMDLLIEVLEISREGLALVSTDELLSHKTTLNRRGISDDTRLLIRDREEARIAGDGSGYFNPKGHPASVKAHTAGVYAWAGTGAAPPLRTYPPPQGWIEVAEIALENNAPSSFGIGLERAVLARDGLLPSWPHSLEKLLTRIEREAQENGQPLPAGYALFKESMT